jgi:hypothetical protein
MIKVRTDTMAFKKLLKKKLSQIRSKNLSVVQESAEVPDQPSADGYDQGIQLRNFHCLADDLTLFKADSFSQHTNRLVNEDTIEDNASEGSLIIDLDNIEEASQSIEKQNIEPCIEVSHESNLNLRKFSSTNKDSKPQDAKPQEFSEPETGVFFNPSETGLEAEPKSIIIPKTKSHLRSARGSLANIQKEERDTQIPKVIQMAGSSDPSANQLSVSYCMIQRPRKNKALNNDLLELDKAVAKANKANKVPSIIHITWRDHTREVPKERLTKQGDKNSVANVPAMVTLECEPIDIKTIADDFREIDEVMKLCLEKEMGTSGNQDPQNTNTEPGDELRAVIEGVKILYGKEANEYKEEEQQQEKKEINAPAFEDVEEKEGKDEDKDEKEVVVPPSFIEAQKEEEKYSIAAIEEAEKEETDVGDPPFFIDIEDDDSEDCEESIATMETANNINQEHVLFVIDEEGGVESSSEESSSKGKPEKKLFKTHVDMLSTTVASLVEFTNEDKMLVEAPNPPNGGKVERNTECMKQLVAKYNKDSYITKVSTRIKSTQEKRSEVEEYSKSHEVNANLAIVEPVANQTDEDDTKKNSEAAKVESDDIQSVESPDSFKDQNRVTEVSDVLVSQNTVNMRYDNSMSANDDDILSLGCTDELSVFDTDSQNSDVKSSEKISNGLSHLIDNETTAEVSTSQTKGNDCVTLPKKIGTNKEERLEERNDGRDGRIVGCLREGSYSGSHGKVGEMSPMARYQQRGIREV